MNQDEAQGAVLIIGLLLGYVYYKTGIYLWHFEDLLALTLVIIGAPFFLYLFVKSRFR